MAVYLTSPNSRTMLGAIIIILFVLFMLKYVFTGDMAKQSNAALKPDNFYDVTTTTTIDANGGSTTTTDGSTTTTDGSTTTTDGSTTTTQQANICTQLQSTGAELNRKMMAIEGAIDENREECGLARSEEHIQDLFYIGALRLIGQNRAYLISKKKFDETISIISSMSDDDLEDFVVDLADVYAKDNGVLDKGIAFYNGNNRQSDSSKLMQLKNAIKGDTPPSVTLLDETNTLIMHLFDSTSGNFNQSEMRLQIGNCYVLPDSDLHGLNKCELNAYLRNLTRTAKDHMNRFCTYCDVTPDGPIPRTRA